MANRHEYVQPELSVTLLEPATMLAESVRIGGNDGSDDSTDDIPQIEDAFWDE